MGTYLNPGNDGFATICEGDYVDKSGLIRLINTRINGPDDLVCISRPRRFGKSYAAQMLCAYYGKNCDSHDLFADKEIASDESYEKYLNKYNVIYVDMTQVMGDSESPDFLSFLKAKIARELKKENRDLEVDSSFSTTLLRAVELTGNKFIMIIDEWDAPIREKPGMERQYLEFLRTLFKSSGTTNRIFAAAYMTGILPIKKDGSQSAISDFREYSLLEPLEFAGYFGFTEKERLSWLASITTKKQDSIPVGSNGYRNVRIIPSCTLKAGVWIGSERDNVMVFFENNSNCYGCLLLYTIAECIMVQQLFTAFDIYCCAAFLYG